MPKMSPHGAPPGSGISSAISSFERASPFSSYCARMRDVVEQTRGWDEAWQLAEVESRAVGGRRFL